MNSNEAVIALVEALDQTGIPYMIVGSFSSNAYGVVRSTKDAAVSSHSPSEFTRSKDVEFVDAGPVAGLVVVC